MKRRRGVMEKESDIRFAIAELSKIVKFKTEDGLQPFIPTKPFLRACKLILLQPLDKIGPSMVVLRQDVNQNIQRLEKLSESDPSIYSNLVEILKKEAREGNGRTTTSCTRAMVWLARSMEFTAALLERLVKDPAQSMEKAVEDSYNVTLKPWHGWISTAAFKVALKLVPESKTFISLLMAEGEDYDTLKEEIKSLISLLLPVLVEIHSILRIYGSNGMKAT